MLVFFGQEFEVLVLEVCCVVIGNGIAITVVNHGRTSDDVSDMLACMAEHVAFAAHKPFGRNIWEKSNNG